MEDYKEQLSHIKEMRHLMERSNKFISLSGLSGILCGIYALIAAAICYMILYVWPFQETRLIDASSRFTESYFNDTIYFLNIDLWLIAIAICTLGLSLLTAFYLSNRKAKKLGEKLWNPASKIMLLHMLLPLAIGGIFGLLLMYKGWFGLVPPITLLFYGMALISAAKFTYGEILYLGILQAILGLINVMYIGYGLFFWALGFGVLHIIYGLVLYKKYDTK